GELVVGDRDQLALGCLVALDDVLVVDLLAALGTGSLVADPSAVFGVDLMESDVVVLGGGVEPDGDVHESERHGTLPDRTHVSDGRHWMCGACAVETTMHVVPVDDVPPSADIIGLHVLVL